MQLRDKKILWHPFTQEKTAAPVIPIKKGKGSYLYDENGKAYLDLISSWWVNLHGHGNQEIARSIYDQAMELEHVIFAGFTHEPAIQLCENLREILPQKLCRFFFSDNGSTAVEVALKMTYQYWQNHDENRHLFLSFEGAYHGDTFGAMAVGKKSEFHDAFHELLFKVLFLPYPNTWQDDEEIELKEQRSLHELSEILNNHGHNIAALILEPIVQGASGMRACRIDFLKQVIEQVKAFGILVIYDEVMTGFCRTGTYFAMNQIGITPDVLCLSKGITGGFLPLALTITSNQIYEAFLSDKWQHAFAHGHSYTANPIACRAAITSLKILRNEICQNAIKDIHQTHLKCTECLRKKVTKIRIIGTISAFDTNIQSQKLREQFLNVGLLLRPLGTTTYLLPPYSITMSELENAYDKILKIMELS